MLLTYMTLMCIPQLREFHDTNVLVLTRAVKEEASHRDPCLRERCDS